MNQIRSMLLTCATLALSSCATVGSGVLTGPPGVNEPDFRKCLRDQGFYPSSRADLISSAQPSLDQLDSEKPLEFVAQTTRVIVDGLMPRVIYNSKGQGNAMQVDESEAPYASPIESDWPLNRFLDCYVAPIGPHDAKDLRAGDADGEGRLLRAHILLTLLARYGAELVVSHSSSKQTAQAEFLLGHITDAEKALRSASAIMDVGYQSSRKADGTIAFPDAPSNFSYENGIAVDAHRTPLTAAQLAHVSLMRSIGNAPHELRWFEFSTRLLRVFQVGVDDERIDAQETLDRASNLIAAFSGGLPAFRSLFKDGLAGLVTIGKTKLYGEAYLHDARESLYVERMNVATVQGGLKYTVKPIKDEWKLWDAQLINACRILAAIAKKDEAAGQCVPESTASAPEKAA